MMGWGVIETESTPLTIPWAGWCCQGPGWKPPVRQAKTPALQPHAPLARRSRRGASVPACRIVRLWHAVRRLVRLPACAGKECEGIA